jgi:hypothetical protein
MKASVIDYVREDLDKEIWKIDGEDITLQEEIKDQILDVVISFFDDIDLDLDKLDKVYIYGSILTNQYNKNTDIDCQILLKEDARKQFPEMTGEDLYDLNRSTLHNIELEGTAHPLNCTVAIGKEIPIGKTDFDPAYDVIADKIIVPPVKEKEDFDPDTEFSKEKEEAIDVMSKLDDLLLKAKIDTVDFMWLDDAKLNVRDKRKVTEKLDRKMDAIQEDMHDLIQAYHELKEARTDALSEDNDAESHHKKKYNIIFKINEKYKYMDTLRAIKQKVEEGLDQADDVEDVAKILNVEEGTQIEAKLNKVSFPFLADPPTPSHEQYKGIIEYPGFHTTGSFEIAAMYAIGRVNHSFTKEANGVHYVTDYPVVVSLDMSGFEKNVDYDAAKMVAETLKIQLNEFIKYEVKEDDSDEELLDKLQVFADSMETQRDVQDDPLDYLSQEVFGHFQDPFRQLLDMPNAVQIIRDYMQTGKIPDELLMKATNQYRYTEDVSEGRILKVWYITPMAAEMEREDQEGSLQEQWPGFDVATEDDLLGGYHHPTEMLVYEAASDKQLELQLGSPERVVEYHGTTYDRIKQAAPELQLPDPPSPPYLAPAPKEDYFEGLE